MTTTHHLTHTGYYAGTPFCGCDKAARAEAGDTFSHVPYGSTAQVAAFLARPEICPACKAEWDAAGEPEAPEADEWCECGAKVGHIEACNHAPEAEAQAAAEGCAYGCETFADADSRCTPCNDAQAAAQAAQATPPDVTVDYHLSVVLVTPQTAGARAWLQHHTDGQWFAGGLAVEPRYLDALVEGLREDGFTVTGGVL